jgi:hypothetical protein
MATMKEGQIGEEIDGHPELSELIRIIAMGDPLVVANGGPEYVIISSGDSDSQFKFSKNDVGYVVTKVRD